MRQFSANFALFLAYKFGAFFSIFAGKLAENCIATLKIVICLLAYLFLCNKNLRSQSNFIFKLWRILTIMYSECPLFPNLFFA